MLSAFYKHINVKHKSSRGAVPLHTDNKILTDDSRKVQAFNTYFDKVHAFNTYFDKVQTYNNYFDKVKAFNTYFD